MQNIYWELIWNVTFEIVYVYVLFILFFPNNKAILNIYLKPFYDANYKQYNENKGHNLNQLNLNFLSWLNNRMTIY